MIVFHSKTLENRPWHSLQNLTLPEAEGSERAASDESAGCLHKCLRLSRGLTGPTPLAS